MNSTPQELKELAELCDDLAVDWRWGFTANERIQLRRIHELLAKLAEEELSK